MANRGAFYMHLQWSIPTAKLEEFNKSVTILTTETRKEVGSVNFFFSQVGDAEEEKTTFALFEEWASEEALAAHKEQPYFKQEFTNGFSKYWEFKQGSFMKGTPL